MRRVARFFNVKLTCLLDERVSVAVDFWTGADKCSYLGYTERWIDSCLNIGSSFSSS